MSVVLLAAIVLTGAVALAIVFALRMRGVSTSLVPGAAALPGASATSGTAAPLRVVPRPASAIAVTPPSSSIIDAAVREATVSDPPISVAPVSAVFVNAAESSAAAAARPSLLPDSAPLADVAPIWFTAFDARSATLDDTARLRLIGDLGVIAKEWCVPLLAAAYEQEPRPGHRQAALVALAACRSRAALPVFSAAAASDDPAARAIAVDALADLQPAAPATLHRVVERH